MININPDVELPEEKPGQKFGYNFLEDLPPIEVGEVIVEGVEIKPDPDTFLKDIDLTLPLKPEALKALQAQDTRIIHLMNRLKVGDLDANVYIMGHGMSASAHGLWDLGELHPSAKRDSSFPHSTPGAVPSIPTHL